MTRRNLYQLLKKNKVSWGHHQKRHIYAVIARKKVILSKVAGLKAVEKKVESKTEEEIQI